MPWVLNMPELHKVLNMPEYALEYYEKYFTYRLLTEEVIGRCSVKKMFLENYQNSQENTCARDSLYEVLKLKQNFRKSKLVTGKTPFFVIDPFYTLNSIFLNIGF